MTELFCWMALGVVVALLIADEVRFRRFIRADLLKTKQQAWRSRAEHQRFMKKMRGRIR